MQSIKNLLPALAILVALILCNGVQAAGMSGCDCSVDNCISASDPPPYSTTCWSNVTIDEETTSLLFCGNSTYLDFSKDSTPQNPASFDLANTTNCGMIMEEYMDPGVWNGFLSATQLYNGTFLYVLKYEDCYLWIGGGEGSTTSNIDANELILVGGYDLIQIMSDSIMNYADAGNAAQMGVCGVLPGCPTNNTVTHEVTKVLDIQWCFGGSNLAEYYLTGEV